jgi:hypothetical protein
MSLNDCAERRIAWLEQEGVLATELAERWDAQRQLRNSASRPEDQAALPPGVVISTLYVTKEDTEFLFLHQPQNETDD